MRNSDRNIHAVINRAQTFVKKVVNSEDILEETLTAIADKAARKHDTMIEEFIRHGHAISIVMQSSTMRQLLNGVTMCLKHIFKASSVNFLFQDKEMIHLLTKEGAAFQQRSHINEQFNVLVPD